MILYYNKQTLKQTQTQSEDTILMSDKLMADYRKYASNLDNKSLELIQEVGKIPYLKRYALDENGTRYSYYLEEMVDGMYVPDVKVIAKELQLQEETRISCELKAAKELALNSITVEVNGKVFDGRAKDQVNIMAAIQAAELLNKTEDTWVLNDNTKQIVTVEELKLALALSIQRVGEIVRG